MIIHTKVVKKSLNVSYETKNVGISMFRNVAKVGGSSDNVV